MDEFSKEEKISQDKIVDQYLRNEFSREELVNLDIESLMPELSIWEKMIVRIRS